MDSDAHLAMDPPTAARDESLGLRAVEVEEAQRERRAAVVAERDPELRAETEAAFDRLDDALDQGRRARRERRDRRDPGAVLVAQREMEPEVTDLDEPDAREPGGESRADAAQAR